MEATYYRNYREFPQPAVYAEDSGDEKGKVILSVRDDKTEGWESIRFVLSPADAESLGTELHVSARKAKMIAKTSEIVRKVAVARSVGALLSDDHDPTDTSPDPL